MNRSRWYVEKQNDKKSFFYIMDNVILDTYIIDI